MTEGWGVFMEEGGGLGQKLPVETAGDQRGGDNSEQERSSPQLTLLLSQHHSERLQEPVDYPPPLKPRKHTCTHTFCFNLNFCLYGCSFLHSHAIKATSEVTH